jgi:NADPH:quinone reductase-like Zn-dependent oxidoreductase
MKATYMFDPGDVRIIDAPDPVLKDTTDALVRIIRACVCGSDLHSYHSMKNAPEGVSMGHEFIGVVEETGADVRTLTPGDLVISPFAFSDGTCEFCRAGLFTSCIRGGFWDMPGMGGAQAEAIRVPFADGTLVKVPGVEENSELLASLSTLSDVYGTGWHAATRAGVTNTDTVAVIRSDTTSNALFAKLQQAAGIKAGIDPHLLVAANSSGGVVGKLISPQNLAIAATAVGMDGQESVLLRKVIGWSVGMLAVLCLLVYLQSTPVLGWMLPPA